jgi:hypothetical protein
MSSYYEKEAKRERLEKQIEKLYKLNFYLYEQNRKIKAVKYLYIKETNELIEINPELLEKYDIINKFIELTNTGCKGVPSDPYLAACTNILHFDINNINNIENQVLDRYYTWKIFEIEKQQHLNQLLGSKANESNYIELQKNELAKLSDELENCFRMYY